jgi:transposase
MNSSHSKLPDDPLLLKEFILSKTEEYEQHIRILEEQVRLLKAKLFGRKSEKLTEEEILQMRLFDEAEDGFEHPSGEERVDTTVSEHTRKKGGRRPLPESLARVDVEHELSEAERQCACGCTMERFGQEVSEKLDIIPASMKVIRHIRYKYACKNCEGVESKEGAVKTALMPPQIIPQGIASPGLIAHILIGKFADALPFYRQEKIFARIGVDICRATMCNWAIHVGEQCGKLMDLMWEEIRSGPLINIDETPLQVLKEPGRDNTSKSYMWVFRGGDPDKPVLIYRYDPSRAGDVPMELLCEYKGYIQTDGYPGYDAIGEKDEIIHLGCWAHVRRKFMDAVKARKKGSKGKKGYADQALTLIRELYAVEKEVNAKGLSMEERREIRQGKSKPLLGKFKDMLDEVLPLTPPQGLLGKAVNYSLNQWDRLEGYTENGLLRPDNNLAENAIRPFVVGRKNWLFSGSPRGANASATIYSLIETAKANELEPYRYLRYLFENLPKSKTEEEYRALLPMNVDREVINKLTL